MKRSAPNSAPPDFEPQLSRLSEDLHALRAAIQAGDWEQVAVFAEGMAPTMDGLRHSVHRRNAATVQQRKRIDDTLNMLRLAIEECSTRRAQILPLIDALDKASNRPEQT